MVNFDTVIDGLDNNLLKEFHKKLLENGCYQGLLNVSEIDETDQNKLKEAVKVGVQGAGYEKLRDIGPESIKKEIESIDNAPVIVQEPIEPESETEAQKSEAQKPKETTETKEKLIQELMHIWSLKAPGLGVPKQYVERYGEILNILNEKHSMTRLDIQKITNISDKAVGRALAQYKQKHIERPDDRIVTKSESKVAEKLTAKVTAEADERIEDDMELAIHIRTTYLKEAYMRGKSLREIVDTAIPIWFNIEGIYDTMLSMERENLTLKEYIKTLESINYELTRRNTNLNRVLISNNAMV